MWLQKATWHIARTIAQDFFQLHIADTRPITLLRPRFERSSPPGRQELRHCNQRQQEQN